MISLDDMDLDELCLHLGPEVGSAVHHARQGTQVPEVLQDTFKADEDDWSEDEFIRMCQDRERFSLLTEVEQETTARWADIERLRNHYVLFEDFLYDCMTELMGFNCTDLQIDIGRYLQSDVRYGMIQAQRSQAKSTIVAMFAVWQLIHDCKHRVLIVSAGSDVAAEIANWVIQIIMGWDILKCMRPDRQHGDRSSSKAFDVHWQLKGPEKSPSVACIGITANMQGRRADLLIPDDIESSKNGTTEVQRAALEHLSKDFTSICQRGRIMYLGTPQTTDSIYTNLPARGYNIRVWTGRYPTTEEERCYGDTLAPRIAQEMQDDPTLRTGGGVDGTRGKPTDPFLLNEEMLTDKELDQGPAYFNLQHMLNTELSDAQKYPLKPRDLIVMPFGRNKAPGDLTWMPNPTNKIPVAGYTCKPQLHRPFHTAQKTYEFEGKSMYVDPAGGGKNGDETVAVVAYFLHGYIYIPEILKLKGGYDESVYEELSRLALRHEVQHIEVESNFGYGALAAAWRPIMTAMYTEAQCERIPTIEDVWESGQKELRIIDTLEPVMSRHRLVIHEDIIEYDRSTAEKYPIDKRESYKLFHQMSKMCMDKGALLHDDVIDALAGAVRYWIEKFSVDEKVRQAQKETDENIEFFKEWGADIGKQMLGHTTDRFR